MNPNLREVLDTMDVPILRKNDFRWLKRNLSIRNGNHPEITNVLNMLDQAIKFGLCKCGCLGQEPSPCPYGHELYGDSTKCNCCDKCARECADDI